MSELELTEDRELWEMQEGEETKAFEGFQSFLCIGGVRTVKSGYLEYRETLKSLINKGQKGGLKPFDPKKDSAPSFYRKWAKDNQWKLRAAHYDAYQATLRQIATEKIMQDGMDLIGEAYLDLLRLQIKNVKAKMGEGVVSNQVNVALRDLFDRFGGQAKQRIERSGTLDLHLGVGKKGKALELFDTEKALKVAEVLRGIEAYVGFDEE